MKSLESKGAPPAGPANQLSDEEEQDLKLAVKTAEKMMLQGKGLDVVRAALKESKDPSSVLGQFFAQLFAKMHESFPKELNVSPRIYLCKGGVLEQLLDFLEERFGLPKDFSDQVFGATVETIKAAAQDPQEEQGEPQGQPEQSEPGEAAPPQGGPMAQPPVLPQQVQGGP